MHTNATAIDRNQTNTRFARAYAPSQLSNAPLKILLVEDSAADAELTRNALDSTDIPYTLEELRRGSDVVPYLTQKGFFADESAPDLILLDLGLPCEDGFEVLEDIAKLRGFVRGIPIVILTGYTHFNYLKKVQELCITDYLTKPCDSGKLRAILSRFECN